ncbi:NAD(+) synthase [[Bacteroides] pectinophilus]|uniref:Glutamine-dependent NAD(+) synthetase n=1 Tax=[Bacteroides] pectinophilus ATCC 43243 TaxID=483218 RepID=B7APX1_9FIRM|nr:NAD+ synthase [[Bacteroides] pectinophilus ATCC 43243]UWN96994.1 NAD(+) synthase [[Bacteroides] pectinophilus]
MKDGYVRVEVVTPDIKVADCIFNTEQICSRIDKAYDAQVSVIVFPEMCITGYTCNDLFLQDTLLSDAQKSLATITEYTKGKNMLTVVGLPFEYCNKLYNVAAVIKDGVILGLVPKKYIPNYNEFYERRQFTEGFDKAVKVCVAGQQTYMGSRILFRCSDFEKLVVGVEICEDLWTPLPPSVSHAMNGATLIVNPSASNETVGKEDYRRSLVTGQSARLVCAYAYASSGDGESTQDIVFGGHDIIAENGTLLAETSLFANNSVINDIDFDRLNSERRRMSTFTSATDNDEYTVVDFSLAGTEYTSLVRFIDPHPFVPENEATRNKRCEAILSIQAMGLKKRLAHIGCKNVVIGISGGLDSTLALLVAVRAYGLLGLDMSGIHAVTMPGFGTTDRTYDNAVKMIKSLGCTFHEISIRESVTRHFEDIGHDINVHDVTYENGQARERTQILMDIANKVNGIVIGTGDMSELALGWATYNGDHMSMYGVNASVPKTLVRHLVRYYAEVLADSTLAKVLYDVLDTPVSPELLPPDENGQIEQKTEDLVGPYELHDFFMYYILRFGIHPAKLYRIACAAFRPDYSEETILKWLKTFYRRFFAQHFKRSCLPDGPKVGTVAVSPRGDLRMPSDACARIWLKELDELG